MNRSTTSPRRHKHRARICALIPTVIAIAMVAFSVNHGRTTVSPGDMVVFAYNDQGMNWMTQDFSELMILPPGNTLHAEVIDRRDPIPRIITSGVAVKYSIPSNTRSSDKTNFWGHAQALLGASPAPNVGLTGFALSGAMVLSPNSDWFAAGIPITPVLDTARENPYPLATIRVFENDELKAQTQAVVPVSWEMNCAICHRSPGVSTATDILRAHDRRHGTTLEMEKPVLCARCHADPSIGRPGRPELPSLSLAMHRAHKDRVTSSGLPVDCFACHPGVRTKYQRDVHMARGMFCESCHGDTAAVANPTRRPWANLPRCADCHQRAEFAFEEPGKLFRESRGHGNVHCAACHGSPHAIGPTVTAVDNVQALRWQGRAGTITRCTLCHQQRPTDSFWHRRVR